MKKILFLIVVLFTLQTIAANNLDSLYTLVNSPSIADSVKLQAYENITKQLLRSNMDSCRTVCKMGLNFSTQIGNQRFNWSFINRQGISFYYEGEYETAMKYYLDALRVAEESKDIFTISQTLNNIAIIYDVTDRYEEAIEFYSKALEIKIQDPETSLMSVLMAKINIAILYGKLGALNKTDSVLSVVLNNIDNIKKHDDKYKILVNIGSTYTFLASHQNKPRLFYEGLKNFFLAETEIDQTDNKLDKITLLLNIGETYLQLEDQVNGLKHVFKAMKIAKEIGSLERLQTIFEVLRNYYYNIENYDFAYKYYDSMQNITEKINSLETQTKIEELKAKYESEKKDKENLALKQKNERQKTINNIFLASIILAVILGIVFTYLFSKLRLKNQELTKQKKQLEDLNIDLKISNEQTEQALEFKSLFLANMSHEIRTPLNIIIGFNSILKKSIENKKLLKYTDSIETSSYNLLRFLNDILDMSKLEAGKVQLSPENINLKLLVSNIKELFSLKADEKDLDLKVEFDRNVPDEVIIDEIRLRQILVNLVGNAIKFTEMGYVKIKVEAPKLNKYNAEFSTTTNLRFHIEDSGIGISKEDLEKIFESFRQVNIKEQKQLGGTGLGLAISKRLTEMMQGEISVISEKGKGSTFIVTLRDIPIGRTISDPVQQSKPLTDDLSFEFTGGTILVADDEEMNRSLIKVCFENTKVVVLEAADGKETIEIAGKFKPEVILMDVKMPVIDGLEATKIIKGDENLKDIQIIAFSASNIFERLEDDEIKLFSGLISKPVLLDELYQKTAEFLPNKNRPGQNDTKQSAEVKAANFMDDLSLSEPLIINKLRVDFKENFLAVNGSNSMKKILKFADELKNFASENNFNKLEKYAKMMREAGDNFDIDQVKKLLKLFPEIIQNTNK